ncbi:MAG TPA: alpha/beta fold hydrolase [Candidatus Baltobacteraceae bacterium]|nr:alpha/beta fold hydrolase [Candidatus Baltobacteraceae bacterium]
MIASQRRVTLDDGASTVLETWGERGPVVLCVHGMASSRRSWERLAQHLDGHFRVVAYDQRGHGDAADVSGPMTLDRGTRDLENVMAALNQPIDLLIGHSWGGAIAIHAGLQVPVWRVAAIDPMVRQASEQWYREFLAELADQFAVEGDARDARIRAEYADWAPVDVEAKVHAVHSMRAAPIEALMVENPPQAWDLRSAIARYDKPLFLAMAVAGESINEPAVLAEIETNRPSNVEIVAFPGAGHNVHRTAFDELAKALDDWLSRT